MVIFHKLLAWKLTFYLASIQQGAKLCSIIGRIRVCYQFIVGLYLVSIDVRTKAPLLKCLSRAQNSDCNGYEIILIESHHMLDNEGYIYHRPVLYETKVSTKINTPHK